MASLNFGVSYLEKKDMSQDETSKQKCNSLSVLSDKMCYKLNLLASGDLSRHSVKL